MTNLTSTNNYEGRDADYCNLTFIGYTISEPWEIGMSLAKCTVDAAFTYSEYSTNTLKSGVTITVSDN